MYDPARDIFTSSEDALGDQNDHDSAERRPSHASIGTQEQSNQDGREAAGKSNEHSVSEVGVGLDQRLACLTTAKMARTVTQKGSATPRESSQTSLKFLSSCRHDCTAGDFSEQRHIPIKD